ncbi:hypothetical protein MRY87_04965 [bacterium]|nr:hypothetical protein [bacterium]
MGTVFLSERASKSEAVWRCLREAGSAVGRGRFALWMLGVLFAFSPLLGAQTRTNLIDHTHDSRGEPEVTLCSQNLENFGSLTEMTRRGGADNEKARAGKMTALVRRFQEVGCDVIAVQELLGADRVKAKAALDELASLLRFRTNREFLSYVGPSNDKVSRVAFLMASDRFEYSGMTSFVEVELPKISEKQAPRQFARGPLELRLRVRGRDGSVPRDIVLVTFHFKSRAFNSADGSDLSWETYRMEMAEALRRIVTRRHQEILKGNGTILALLGDRNSHFDTGSAKLLTGELVLPRFQGAAPCRLNQRGLPLCKPGSAIPPAFLSVLTGDPQTFRTAGSYVYENTFSWLDDILLPIRNLPLAYAHPAVEGDYESGTFDDFELASDHKLVYVRLNW